MLTEIENPREKKAKFNKKFIFLKQKIPTDECITKFLVFFFKFMFFKMSD